MKPCVVSAALLLCLVKQSAAQGAECMSDSQCAGEKICELSKCSTPLLGDLFPGASTPRPGAGRHVIKASRADCKRLKGQTEEELRGQAVKAIPQEVVRCVLPLGVKPTGEAASAVTK